MFTQEFEKTAEPWFYDRGSKDKAAIIKARNKRKKKDQQEK